MIIVITNQKGGVGKTTTAINLSAACAAAGKKVLLIDLDPQSNSSLSFVDPESVNGSAYELFTETARPFNDFVYSTELDKLQIVPARSISQSSKQSSSAILTRSIDYATG